MMTLEHAIAKCRQWLFPCEFRIRVEGDEDWTDLLLTLMAQQTTTSPGDSPSENNMPLPAEAETAPAEPEYAPPPETVPPGVIDADFAKKLCTGLYRLKRNIARLEERGSDVREVQNMNRVFERADPLLETYGIRYADLTGQTYHDGRNDFEPLGRPEEVEGLTTKKISLCEYPVVYLHGKLVQRARGTVAVPREKSN